MELASLIPAAYPNDDEKAFLAESAGLEVKQLNYWLTNVRKRVWGPLRKERGLKLPTNADRMRTMARQRLMSAADGPSSAAEGEPAGATTDVPVSSYAQPPHACPGRGDRGEVRGAHHEGFRWRIWRRPQRR